MFEGLLTLRTEPGVFVRRENDVRGQAALQTVSFCLGLNRTRVFLDGGQGIGSINFSHVH